MLSPTPGCSEPPVNQRWLSIKSCPAALRPVCGSLSRELFKFKLHAAVFDFFFSGR